MGVVALLLFAALSWGIAPGAAGHAVLTGACSHQQTASLLNTGQLIGNCICCNRVTLERGHSIGRVLMILLVISICSCPAGDEQSRAMVVAAACMPLR